MQDGLYNDLESKCNKMTGCENLRTLLGEVWPQGHGGPAVLSLSFHLKATPHPPCPSSMVWPPLSHGGFEHWARLNEPSRLSWEAESACFAVFDREDRGGVDVSG